MPHYTAILRCGLLSGLLAGASACTTSKFIDTAIDIEAPPCAVYDVLTDFERYPEWNPYHVAVSGRLEAGASLAVRVSRPDGETVDVPHVRLLELEPCKTLVWGGGVRGVFKGEHRFDLSERAEGATHLSHTELFSGLFIGFADLPASVLQQGYEEMNAALKQHVETAD
ncbi:MAG: SRPBCC domain-containing protein [Pseudomonadota bacterium]